MANPDHSTGKRSLLGRYWGTVLLVALLLGAATATIAVADEHDFFGSAASAGLTVPGAKLLHPQGPAAPTLAPKAPGLPNAGGLNVYAHTALGMLSPLARRARYLVYVPDSQGNGVYVINPRTYKVEGYYPTGQQVQHVVPAWDLHTLYATNDQGNSLTPFDPTTGRPAGPNIPVADPYNMYFTPDGQHAIVVEEAQSTLAFRDPHTFALQKALPVRCSGIDHMDFSADGRFALASCEFSGQMAWIDVEQERVIRYLYVGGSPQDVKLSPDGRTFYVANRFLPARKGSGVQLVDSGSLHVLAFRRTRLDAHGLYISRNTRYLYVTSRAGGAVSVLDLARRKIIAVWPVPGTPDMGGVSPDGQTLWLAGRYSGAVYAISARTGRVLATIRAGISPHGLCVWPQPGRYSTGHTGVMR